MTLTIANSSKKENLKATGLVESTSQMQHAGKQVKVDDMHYRHDNAHKNGCLSIYGMYNLQCTFKSVHISNIMPNSSNPSQTQII